MGKLATALTNLAAISVQGAISYALGDTPEGLTRTHLPALVIFPEVGGHAPGVQPTGFSEGDAQFTTQIAHVLIYGPAAANLGRRGSLPDLIDLIDNYTEALADDPTLSGALPLPLRFTVQIGIVRYGGVEYYGVTFLHTWVLQVG